MNIFQKVILLFKVKGIVETEIKEAQIMNNGTPGWKTSEFWMQLASQAGVLWAAVQGFIPWAKYAAVIITVVGTAVYTVSRTIYKAISDVKAAQATQPTPAVTVATTRQWHQWLNHLRSLRT